MEIYEKILGDLTPTELDELFSTDSTARAPRGALTRIERAAMKKAGIRAKKRKSVKLILVAAVIAAASAATIISGNASGGKFFTLTLFGEEVEGEYRDYVDHDGYRHVTYEVVVPIDLENYALLIDVDEPDPEKAVQVFTEETHPEIFAKIEECEVAYDKAYNARRELKKAGVPDEELPEVRNDLLGDNYGIELTDSQYFSLTWSGSYTDENGMKWNLGFGHNFGGEFLNVKGKDHEARTFFNDNRNEEEGTKSIGLEFIYYVGKPDE